MRWISSSPAFQPRSSAASGFAQARVGQRGPLFRWLFDAQPGQDVAVVDHAEGGQHHARPAINPVAKGFAADGFGKRLGREPVGMPGHDRDQAGIAGRVAGHQIAGIGQLLEVVRAAAKEQVDAHADGRGEKIATGAAGWRSRIRRVRARIGKARRDVMRPGLLLLGLPVILKRPGEFGLEEQGDLGRTAGYAPVQVHRLSGPRLPLVGEGPPEFMAHPLVVRGDDDQAPVVPLRRIGLFRLEQKRADQGGQQGQQHPGGRPPAACGGARAGTGR